MTYRFATEDRDYSDFAAGRVFHSLPGAFPVRLASEIFQRCMAIRRRDGLTASCTVYDPCCGSGYMLSTMAYLHRDKLRRVIGSDVDASALAIAERNLSLLSVSGLDKRIAEIEAMLAQYGKQSHREALDSAQRLRQGIIGAEAITIRLFVANAFKADELVAQLNGETIDMVITDVPYDNHTAWAITDSQHSAVWQLLDSLRMVLSPQSVIAICTDKKQKATHEAYSRVEQFQIGKRRVVIFKVR